MSSTARLSVDTPEFNLGSPEKFNTFSDAVGDGGPPN